MSEHGLHDTVEMVGELDGVVESEVGARHLKEEILELVCRDLGASAHEPGDQVVLVQVEEAVRSVEDVESEFEEIGAGFVCFLDSQILYLFFLTNPVEESEKRFLVNNLKHENGHKHLKSNLQILRIIIMQSQFQLLLRSFLLDHRSFRFNQSEDREEQAGEDQQEGEPDVFCAAFY